MATDNGKAAEKVSRNVRIDPDVWSALEARAVAEDRSTASLIRRALADFVAGGSS